MTVLWDTTEHMTVLSPFSAYVLLSPRWRHDKTHHQLLTGNFPFLYETTEEPIQANIEDVSAFKNNFKDGNE